MTRPARWSRPRSSGGSSRRPGGTGEVLARIRAIASGFGLDTATIASARRNHANPQEIAWLIDGLVDPLLVLPHDALSLRVLLLDGLQ